MLAYDIILELNAPVAQLDRVTGYEPVGRGFESLLAHQSFLILTNGAPIIFDTHKGKSTVNKKRGLSSASIFKYPC